VPLYAAPAPQAGMGAREVDEPLYQRAKKLADDINCCRPDDEAGLIMEAFEREVALARQLSEAQVPAHALADAVAALVHENDLRPVDTGPSISWDTFGKLSRALSAYRRAALAAQPQEREQ